MSLVQPSLAHHLFNSQRRRSMLPKHIASPHTPPGPSAASDDNLPAPPSTHGTPPSVDQSMESDTSSGFGDGLDNLPPLERARRRRLGLASAT
jgi:hypothetical protein